MELLGWVQQRLQRGLEHLSYEGGLRELSLFNIKKKQLREELINVYKHWKEECQGDGPVVDQALLSGAEQWNKRPWADTDAQEIPLEHKEELIYYAGDHTLEQIAREVVQSPSLEMFKNCLDTIP